jgi:hypothetical protein
MVPVQAKDREALSVSLYGTTFLRIISFCSLYLYITEGQGEHAPVQEPIIAPGWISNIFYKDGSERAYLPLRY